MMLNWETGNVQYEIDKDPDWVYDLLDGFVTDGVPESELRGALAEAIYDRLSREKAEIARSGKLIIALISNPGRVDCKALADRYVWKYGELPPDEKAVVPSRCGRNAGKPSGRSGKAPAKKSTAKKTTGRS